jgi:hypothetical protein
MLMGAQDAAASNAFQDLEGAGLGVVADVVFVVVVVACPPSAAPRSVLCRCRRKRHLERW